MDFELYPDITKELIESKVSQETLMSTYFQRPVSAGLVTSSLRSDRKATCSFFRNKRDRLMVKDFGNGFCGDWIAVGMARFDCSYGKILQIAANDFGIVSSQKLIKNPITICKEEFKESTSQAIIRVEIRDWQDYELRWWENFGVSKDTLKKFNIFSCKTIWLNNCVFHVESPQQYVFGYYGGKRNGIEIWKIYMPKRKSFRFISNWPSTKLYGIKLRTDSDFVVITKSLKDVCALYEFGVPAIAVNSETVFLTNTQYERLKSRYKYIFLLWDNDNAGLSNAWKIRKKHSDIIPLFIPKIYAKDFSDLIKNEGKQKAKELIDQAKEWFETKKESIKS